jgi:hypothetical protein
MRRACSAREGMEPLPGGGRRTMLPYPGAKSTVAEVGSVDAVRPALRGRLLSLRSLRHPSAPRSSHRRSPRGVSRGGEKSRCQSRARDALRTRRRGVAERTWRGRGATRASMPTKETIGVVDGEEPHPAHASRPGERFSAAPRLRVRLPWSFRRPDYRRSPRSAPEAERATTAPFGTRRERRRSAAPQRPSIAPPPSATYSATRFSAFARRSRNSACSEEKRFRSASSTSM